MQRVAALAGRPLRIALLTSSRSWRGSSMVFAALARGLADRGHTTTALAAYEPVATGFATQGVSGRATSGTLPPRRSADPWPWSTASVHANRPAISPRGSPSAACG